LLIVVENLESVVDTGRLHVVEVKAFLGGGIITDLCEHATSYKSEV
jgi:hypothetical protein